MYYYLPENDAYCPSQCPCLPGIEGQSKLSRKDSIRVKLECSVSEKKVRHVISSISARAPIACEVDRSCLHKQMKLPSGHSIGSFYTSHFISIIPLSITAREAWNLSVVDESERIQQILFGLHPAAQRLVISPTFRDSWPIRRTGLLCWRSWVVSFMSWNWHWISIELN